VLWYTLKEGPGGQLEEVTLACVAGTKPGAAAGAMTWTAFTVESAMDERRHPEGDPKQDELWLATGDQVFGRVLSSSRHEIVLHGRFGKRAFSWADLRGWYPRRATVRPPPVAGSPVRLEIGSGLDAVVDVLVGVVTALDEKTLTLRHPLLGEVRVDRKYVVGLRSSGRTR
jgi:hypothetical protein